MTIFNVQGTLLHYVRTQMCVGLGSSQITIYWLGMTSTHCELRQPTINKSSRFQIMNCSNFSMSRREKMKTRETCDVRVEESNMHSCKVCLVAYYVYEFFMQSKTQGKPKQQCI